MNDTKSLDNHDRSQRLWGVQSFEKLLNSRVCVIGLGGVGSFIVSSLARGGVGHLFLIDGDVVDASNMNRQAFAFTSTIGKRKTEVAQKFVSEVSPTCQCKVRDLFIKKETFSSAVDVIEDFGPDWIIDAIDSINSKLLLAEHFANNPSSKFIASTGVANKTDVAKLHIDKLSKTKYDPICKIMRCEARRRNIGDFLVGYSSEEVHFTSDSAITRTGGRKILGSTSFLPALMGHMLAGHVMNDIAGRLQ